MDQESVRAILRSSEKYMQNLTDENFFDGVIEKVPIVDKNVTSALSMSLADLLTCRVTPDAHQRYTVRIKIIEMLREWIQPPIGLTSFQAFYQSNNLLKLCQGMIKNFLLYNNFDNISSSNDFILFGRELINIANRDPMYIIHVKNFIVKIINSDIAFDIYDVLESILDHDEKFQIEFSLIERLYIINCTKFIEEPLIDCYLDYIKTKNNETFIKTNNFDRLMCRSAKSAEIFQIISSILKVLFVRVNYSSSVLDYIQFVIKNIILNRNDDEKCIVNLYPINLQSSIFLLQINPCYHTDNSKHVLLQTLKCIYLDNTDQVLTILTHFPEWLDQLLNYIRHIIIN